MNVDYRKFAKFDYNSVTSPKDKFRLGDVVIKINDDEIGVIIQSHGDDEYRTDMFGNCSNEGVRLATLSEIELIRPSLLK